MVVKKVAKKATKAGPKKASKNVPNKKASKSTGKKLVTKVAKKVPAPTNLPYAEIELEFGAEPPMIHCPFCGNSYYETDKACPHLVFIHMGAIGGFDFQRKDFEKKAESLSDEDQMVLSTKEQLQKMGYGASLIALEVTYGGMACGPVWYTDVYGFDAGVGLE